MAITINIGGRDVAFAAPASFPIRYRNMTTRDFFKDMQTISDSTEEDVKPKKKNMFAKPKNEKEVAEETPALLLNDKWDTTILFNLLHVMACAADTSTNTDLIDWIDSFEEFPIFTVFTEVLPELTRSMKSAKKQAAAVAM